MWHIYLDDGSEIAAQICRPATEDLQAIANDWGFTVYLSYNETIVEEVSPA